MKMNYKKEYKFIYNNIKLIYAFKNEYKLNEIIIKAKKPKPSDVP